MRITTWNCYRGQPARKAAALASLAPDLVALQECARPVEPDDGRLAWVGDSDVQGIALLCAEDLRLEVADRVDGAPTALPVRVSIEQPFQVLVLWTHPRPTYNMDARTTLEAYGSFIAAAPTIVLGDLNASPVFDRDNRRFPATELLASLSREFGLVSAYHSFTGETPGRETRPTLYWQFKQSQPFHIDYCLVPEDWTHRIRGVEVGSFEAFEGLSDHRPLTVDLDL